MEPLRIIPIHLIDFRFEKIIKDRGCHLKLFNCHIEYRVNYESELQKDREDISLGWRRCHIEEDVMVLKRDINGVTCLRSEESENWQVKFYHWGPDNISIPFKKKLDAEELYKILVDYLLA